jgi:hypothetical protein
MAKRVRGSSSRPGQRTRLQRRASTTRPAADPTSTPSTGSVSLTAAEEARAAELEAQIVAAERAAETNAARARERSRRPAEAEVRVRSGSIAERASHEYAYVLRDVRRIVLIGGSLIALLLALWIILEATGVGRL